MSEVATTNVSPNLYEDGFNRRTVIGALFVGLIMAPASIYLALALGAGIGEAAQWVTIILFTEVARRSLMTLKRQEVYILYYVAAGLAGGGVFFGLLEMQYLVQSPQAEQFGIAQLIPHWAAPSKDSAAILERKLWAVEWWPALGLILLGQIMGRLNVFGLGYFLYRITYDVEKLPYPMAPIAVGGATALAEATTKEESWRWPVFSTGCMLGVFFGILYLGVPGLTGLFMSRPFYIFPIPFLDLTTNIENILPGVGFAVNFDIGGFLIGMVLPFPILVGGFVAMVLTSLIATPVLYQFGCFPHWRRGMGFIPTKQTTDFDFWMSIGIGLGLAVALIGIGYALKALVFNRPKAEKGVRSWSVPAGRGDIPMWAAMMCFLVSTTGYIVLCRWLVPGFPLWILLFFGFLWTPLNSYISARMIGLTGSGVGFPFLREASFVLSGCKGVDIWFAPIPLNDMGGVTQLFVQLDMVKVKFGSLIKAELLMIPIGVVTSFLFCALFWYTAAIPSVTYPFTAKMWPLNMTYRCLFMTATLDNASTNIWIFQAIKLWRVMSGLGLGFVLFGIFTFLKLPLLAFYGFVGGINASPFDNFKVMAGALIGRYYFAKKFGDKWYQYTPVLVAGYSCGMGLVGMWNVALTLISKSITSLPF